MSWRSKKDSAVTDYFVRRMADKKATDDTIDRAGVALGAAQKTRVALRRWSGMSPTSASTSFRPPAVPAR